MQKVPTMNKDIDNSLETNEEKNLSTYKNLEDKFSEFSKDLDDN